MRVMILGGGAREHALAWKLKQSPTVRKLYAMPGNPGIAELASCLEGDINDPAAVVQSAQEHQVGLVIVGPEAPLAQGVVDMLQTVGIPAFGPTQRAAELESSKIFSKNFMRKYGIPTADFATFEDAASALQYIDTFPDDEMVVKADGLAGGKGVIVARSRDDARAAVQSLMSSPQLADAASRIIIEQKLVGEELSYHVICDGERFTPLKSAQDHKRLLDGDLGPNTGGMGAYAPAPLCTSKLEGLILTRIVEPTLAAMALESRAFRGVLFVGLMIVDGKPFVLEYNVRFGDPETTAILPLLESDLAPWLLGSAKGELPDSELRWKNAASLSVVLASQGYPASPLLDQTISGITNAKKRGCNVFQAGTRLDNHELKTAGGRVLVVNALANTLSDAAREAYAATEDIQFEGRVMRRDIGHHAFQSGLKLS